MRATITDLKLKDGARFKVDLSSANTYYPFGMLLPERNWSSEWYRYGFQGQEKDDEVKGEGNSLDFGARIYDSRLGRWLSLDPHKTSYTAISPYSFSLNSPLLFNDPDGKDAKVTVLKYPNGGGKILISSTIYITGARANQFNANIYTNKAKELYKPGKYTNDSGKEFEIIFDIQYKFSTTIKNEDLKPGENMLRYPNDNSFVSAVQAEINASIDSDGNLYDVSKTTGTQGDVSKSDAVGTSYNVTLHETLHFIGLSDRYSRDEKTNETTPDAGFEDDYMGTYRGTEMNQVHYNNWGKAFSDKAEGEYILKNKVDIKSSDGSLKGGSSDGKRPVKK